MHQLQSLSPSLSCSIVFFSSLERSRYLSLFSFSFSLTLWSAGTAKSTTRQVLFFLSFFTFTRSGRLVEKRSSVCISKSLRIFYVYYYHYHITPRYRLIGQISRVFANGPGDLGSIPSHVIPKTRKMVLDTALLNTQQYKVRIKGKVDQSRERSNALPYISV